jgi:hypothetical protein
MRKKASSVFLAILFLFAMVGASSAQKLTASVQHKLESAVAGIHGAKVQLAQPRALRSGPALFHGSVGGSVGNNSAPNGQAGIKGNPGGLPGIDSVPNFTRAFSSQGQVWPFTMMGNDPLLGHRTRIPARVLAVSLELQNADLVTSITVSIQPFEELAMHSPNFVEADYASGEDIQYADAIQRAEFFHSMKKNWHTELHPSRIVDHVTIKVPFTTKVTTADANGNPVDVDVPTYITGTADDGSTFVLLLDQFFNDAFFNAAVEQIAASHFTTDALNILLFPNTFIFSLDPNAFPVLGFHTFIFDPTANPLPIWVTLFTSWISPGIFDPASGIQDVTTISHEITEAFNNPFLINSVPAWQFPNSPGSCQDNLEIADPIEVLPHLSVRVRIERGRRSFVYHPQNMALLQWFEDAVPSDAIRGAYSFPDTRALTTPAVPFGQLTCQ